jgi:bisphosphoglycerate-independent phosphoglycerate mutase (AlkP superfamily)
MHTYDDAMFYIKGYPLGNPSVKIFDIMPTILKLMGEEIPPDLDGKVLI